MTKPFYAEPILNSPYLPPTRHHALDEDGQPLRLRVLALQRTQLLRAENVMPPNFALYL